MEKLRRAGTLPATLLLGATLILSAAIVFAQGGHADVADSFVPPPSDSSGLDDPVTRLAKRIAAGQVSLMVDDKQGPLTSLLRELNISVSSQVLVFSKTSLQHEDITPRTPRAIYFNDDVYVGFVPDGRVLEISAVDPRRGAIFYTLTHSPQASLRLVTNVECVQCHTTPATRGIPGHLLRSVFVSGDGRLAPRTRSFLTDHRSPIEERWGGWYVTGTAGGHTHMGNAFLRFGEDETSFDRTRGTSITSVANRIDRSRYPSSESDIVALMVLGHQVHMHNLIAQLHHMAGNGEPTATYVEELLRYMLFVDEAPLHGPVTGTTTFGGMFEGQGPADSKGRSLRQFDLRTRLFRYPCSYLIYSEAFQALPPPVKGQVYGRLVDVLAGRDTSPEFASITAGDRTAIAEILRETDPQFAAAWR